MSRDVLFDELASWYSLLSPTPEDFIPIIEDEASEAELIQEEEEIETLEEGPISFRVSGPNEEQIDMSASDEDSVMQSLWWKPRKRLIRSAKGKKKTSKHDNLEGSRIRANLTEA